MGRLLKARLHRAVTPEIPRLKIAVAERVAAGSLEIRDVGCQGGGAAGSGQRLVSGDYLSTLLEYTTCKVVFD